MTDPWIIVLDEVLTFLRRLPSNTFDALLTDPPYGWKFMGQKWDYEVPSVDVWREACRVLKPGAPLLSFGGRRTYHRIVCGIEDGGFEVCDQIDWIFAKGMPHPASTCDKFLDKAAGAERKVVGERVLTGNAAVSCQDKGGTYGIQVGGGSVTVPVTEPATELAKLWQGHAIALSPAHEPVCLACKPFDGTVANNIEKWGVGGWAIDDCRIGGGGQAQWTAPRGGDRRTAYYADQESDENAVLRPNQKGRWPKTLILGHAEGCELVGTKPGQGFSRNTFDDGAKPFGGGAGHPYTSQRVPDEEEIWHCVPGCPVRDLDLRIGNRPSRKSVGRNGGGGKIMSGLTGKPRGGLTQDVGWNEDGLPSRFFYSTKVNSSERHFGLPDGEKNLHKTLKPISLCKYLAALLRPPRPEATLLVPYAGTASEVIGALLAGWQHVVGIEQEPEYVYVAEKRIRAWVQSAA